MWHVQTNFAKYQCSSARRVLPKSSGVRRNCLYRTVSLALYGTENYHVYVRIMCTTELLECKSTYDGSDADVVFADSMLPFQSFKHTVRSSATSIVIQSYIPPTTIVFLGRSPYTTCVVRRGIRHITASQGNQSQLIIGSDDESRAIVLCAFSY